MQTVSKDFPSELLIDGAVAVSSHPEAGTVTWQWRVVQPTRLREYQVYSKVSSRHK